MVMRWRPEAGRSSLRKRMGVHDRRQFELKLEYRPDPGERRARYEVEVFACMPASLHVTPESVSTDALYAGIRNYVRLKTPELDWKELLEGADSPLLWAAAEGREVAAGGDPGRFVYACKLFASVVRGALRELPRRAGEVRRAGGAGREELEVLIAETRDGVRRVLERFRSLRGTVEARGVPERARAAYRLADEYTSLSTEQAFRKTIARLARLGPSTAAVREELFEGILAEDRYREERGFPTRLDPDSDNEVYLHRAGVLKKFCSSALFLQIRRHAARRPWQELLFAVAAGIAMAFATVIAFWAQARDNTLGFQLFVILVVAYMFKDRIKEGARGLFARFLQRRLYDRRIRIDDPAGGRLGLCREKIEYLSPGDVPASVAEARTRGMDAALRVAEADLEETVFRYRKEIRLDARRVLSRGAGVTDILRFHIGPLLREMDEPYHRLAWVEPDSHRVRPIRAAKVYHADIVFRFRSRRGTPFETHLMRLVLDRRGIKRIE